MYRKLMSVLCTIILLNHSLLAQTYPKGYFRNPMNIPMQLVANFGEIRTNHWHMGLDIRTQQRENLPVHAAAEGYISRVSIYRKVKSGAGSLLNYPIPSSVLYAPIGHLLSCLLL